MFLSIQPAHILTHIFKYLDYDDHFKLRFMCKMFQLIIDSESISGSEPRNWFEFMLDNNIYYAKKYINILDEPIAPILASLVIIDNYSDEFSMLTIRKLMIIFYQNNYVREEKFYKYLSKSQTITNSHNIYKNNFNKFMVEHNVSSGDLINLQKINVYKNNYFKMCGHYILFCATIYGQLKIIEYVLKNYDIQQYNIYQYVENALVNRHYHIIDYFLTNCLEPNNNLLYMSIRSNNLKLLEYLKKNNFLPDDQIILFDDIYDVLNIDLLMIKFYANNFETTEIFEKNIKFILHVKINLYDVECVDYILIRFPKLITYVKQNIFDRNMFYVFAKYQVLFFLRVK